MLEEKKQSADKYLGLEIYRIALEKEGKLEEAMQIGNQLNDDAKYQEYKNNWLMKKIKDDKTKSRNNESERGTINEPCDGNEQAAT